MRCDDARTGFLAGTAGQAELDHLASCSECRQEWEALETSHRVLEDPAFWEEPPPGLEDRVVAIVAGVPDEERAPTRHLGRWILGAGTAAVLVGVVAWAGLRNPGPDWEVPLPGTDAAPQAVGIVKGWNEDAGTRVVLEVEGLPPAPEGSVYEFWFTREQSHISAGTFVASGKVELQVGVSRADFPRLWITLEPLDDDESPSPETVMDTG